MRIEWNKHADSPSLDRFHHPVQWRFGVFSPRRTPVSTRESRDKDDCPFLENLSRFVEQIAKRAEFFRRFVKAHQWRQHATLTSFEADPLFGRAVFGQFNRSEYEQQTLRFGLLPRDANQLIKTRNTHH
ncbi:hypothetical protein [Paraburkholderia aromaticivorans]|uniref:hypothetical protein n=1 Tax=Paraburkholderia aromaticivorans TaxID=2026199 RepID=UPI00197D438A